jgi:adenylate kinase family enzyme
MSRNIRRNSRNRKAVMLVGLPGMGKTSIAAEMMKKDPSFRVIEQDAHYANGKADTEAYLEAIKDAVSTHSVILCKNHHTEKSRDEVMRVLRRKRVRCVTVNLVPEVVDESVISNLLDRIEKRNDGSSHLKIDSKHTRDRARQNIVYGFVKKYEEPNEPFVRLNYLDDVEKQAEIVFSLL